MSEQQTFSPTPADYARAQAILNQLAQLYQRASANGGSVIPELNVSISTDEELKAYAIIQHSGHGECAQTHTGWVFKYRPKGAQPGVPIAAADPMKQALGRRSTFWEIFEKARGGGGD